MLKPREQGEFGSGLPPIRAQWRELLHNNEQSFLSDNQLSAFVAPTRPGCERIHFYPLPFPHHLASGKWDFAELRNRDSLRSTGPALEITPEETQLSFWPHLVEKQMTTAGAHIAERSMVSGNVLAIDWEISGLDSVTLQFGLPFFAATVTETSAGLLAAIKEQVFVAIALAGPEDVCWRTEEVPFAVWAEVALGAEAKLCLALCCGYDKAAVVRAAQHAVTDPASVLQAAEKTWDDYFAKIVPHFECSDRSLERLYYYQACTTRANLYDIPFEPFTHPYTCPWKTGAVWQWSWNTPMNSVCERWLNDKSIGAGGILLEATNGGALNIGTYLHPMRKPTALRGHNEYMGTIREYLKSLPEDYDREALTTMPHTTPNGLLGVWELYLCSGDSEFLRKALEMMREAEVQFSRHELDSGLCTATFVDDFDHSLRWRPFYQAFTKGDPDIMFKLDTPFIAVDYNCYLHALRERIIEAAHTLGDSSVAVAALRGANARLQEAVNKYLWDEADGFYYDADPRDMSRTKVKSIAAFSALYAGIADEKQAARLVEHLVNPAEFGTPYPCPSVSRDTPEIDPSLNTYGGDCLVTSGLWFTVEGLVRYGYQDLAADYVVRAIEMMSKDGPSSSYSYDTLTGAPNQERHTLAAQGSILTDLICKYLIGILPRAEGEFSIRPLALPRSGVSSFVFGPYRYVDKWITVRYDQDDGYYVAVTTAAG